MPSQKNAKAKSRNGNGATLGIDNELWVPTKQLRATNGVERLHREVRRRAHVVSIFPNPASCLRLVSAILAEISEEWLTGRTYVIFEGAT